MSGHRWLIGILLAAAAVGTICVGAAAGGITLWALAPRLIPNAPASSPGTSTDRISIDLLGTDLDGHEWKLSDLQGRPYVLNFWATWCPPCQEELPEMQRLAQEFSDRGVTVLLINDGETATQAREYLQYHGLSLPCISDPTSRLARRYRVRGLPTTIMISADGEVKARLTGYAGPEHLRRAFERLID